MNAARVVLDGIPGFANATIESRLDGGVASRSYRVKHNGGLFVLRIDTPEAARLGLNRTAEHAVIRAVAGAGLGPGAVYCEPEAGILLRPFIPGRPWTRDDLLQAKNLARLADRLRGLHDIPFAGSRFDPVAAAARYAEQLGSDQARAHLQRLRNIHASLERVEPVLCHNDLVCQNILEAGGPVLIDWEFAAPGDSLFDLAVVVQHHDLGSDLAGIFLQAYFGRPPTAGERARFSAQCALYRELLGLWNLRLRDL
jgi:thiamine kinase-like enzyme